MDPTIPYNSKHYYTWAVGPSEIPQQFIGGVAPNKTHYSLNIQGTNAETRGGSGSGAWYLGRESVAEYLATSWTWDRWEMYTQNNSQAGTIATGEATDNAIVQVWINADQRANATNQDLIGSVTPANARINGIHIGAMWQEAWRVDQPVIYYDDIYIANTRARVELGDNSIFGNCTKREIQVVQNWSTGEIIIEPKYSEFPEGSQAYLFVVHEDGSASAGHSVTIGSGAAREQPWINLSTPAGDGETYLLIYNTVDLGGTAGDNNSVVSVTWENNRGGSGIADGTTNWSIQDVALQEGDNVITITATDNEGLSDSATLTVRPTPGVIPTPEMN